MTKKTAHGINPHVVDKGLIISQYKGVYQAKRMMMKAGLPVDVINKLLLQDKTTTKPEK